MREKDLQLKKKGRCYLNKDNKYGLGYSVKQRGLVQTEQGGLQKVVIENCKFVVQMSGYRNTMAELKPCGNPKKKYVHAFVDGTIVSADNYLSLTYSQLTDSRASEAADMWTRGFRLGKYDPKMGPWFTLDGHKLEGAERVELRASGMWVKNPTFQVPEPKPEPKDDGYTGYTMIDEPMLWKTPH